MNDILFWVYWSLSLAAIIAAIIGLILSIRALVRLWSMIKRGGPVDISQINATFIGMIYSCLLILITLLFGTVIKQPADIRSIAPASFISSGYFFGHEVTHAYWVSRTNSLVLNDIAPAVYDKDLVNIKVDAHYLFQSDLPYYAEVKVTGVRPFSREKAEEFEVLPFVRTEWQINPLERLADDRRYRTYQDDLKKLPAQQRDSFTADLNHHLSEYLSSTTRPSIMSADVYLEQRLSHDWCIETLTLIPKTNNW